MNNLYSVGVIGKYLSFLSATRVFSLASSGFITVMRTCPALDQLNIFWVVQHVELWTHVNFLVS
jgi:hypothetical protein